MSGYLRENDVVLKSMARTLFVCAWADRMEELKRTKGWSGKDLMDLAPKTPRRALLTAAWLIGKIETANGYDISALLAKAWKADHDRWEERAQQHPEPKRTENPFTDDGWLNDVHYQDSFGHYLVMGSLGHGVSWFDDHAKFPLRLPYITEGYELK